MLLTLREEAGKEETKKEAEEEASLYTLSSSWSPPGLSAALTPIRNFWPALPISAYCQYPLASTQSLYLSTYYQYPLASTQSLYHSAPYQYTLASSPGTI